jgi:mRNA interferase RelE/StbE
VSTVLLTDPALDDLRRLGPAAAPRAIEVCAALADDPESGTSLVDDTTSFRVLAFVGGSGRIVYDLVDGVVTVRVIWVDGLRSDGQAYAEALRRMQSADPPDLVALARILQRLGRLTGTRPVSRGREPVPDWLAESLVSEAGLSVLEVAAMDALTAFAVWNRVSQGESVANR